jgi:hypothetical protein
VSPRVTFFLFSVLLLGTVLLIQRSLTTYYAYQSSELAQEKKVMVKQMKALEVQMRRVCRPQVLYEYWAKNRDRFDFDLEPLLENNKATPSTKDGSPAVVQSEPKTRFTSLRSSP